MHLIQTREIVDWSDIYPPTIDDLTLHNGFNPCTSTYVAWERILLVVSLILNIGVGIVIWRTPLFRGVFLHVTRTSCDNIRRFLLRQNHATEAEMRYVNGLVSTSVQENEEGSSGQQVFGIALHDNVSSVSAPRRCSLSAQRCVSMPIDLSSIDREQIVDTNDGLTVSCDANRCYFCTFPSGLAV